QEAIEQGAAIAVLAQEEELHGDRAGEREVVGAPHAGHAALADHRHELVAARYELPLARRSRHVFAPAPFFASRVTSTPSMPVASLALRAALGKPRSVLASAVRAHRGGARLDERRRRPGAERRRAAHRARALALP